MSWPFPGEITGSTDWLSTLWAQRETLHQFNITLLWGVADTAFRSDNLDRWIEEFPDAHVTRLEDVGRFIPLEATDALVDAINR